MSRLNGKYGNLKYLDVVNQPYCKVGIVSKLRSPLRQAVNTCRSSNENMEELITLLESTLQHINSIEEPKTPNTVGTKKRGRPKKVVKKDNEEDYQLPC